MNHVLKDLLNDLEQEGEVSVLDMDMIEADPDQPRKIFSEESIQQLKESIIQHGLLQPILVYRKLNKYYIIAGERRFRACQKAGLVSIPARIVQHHSDENRMEMSLVENIQRENLNPMDIALAFHMLVSKFQLTQEEVAQKIAKSRSYVANMMRLVNLPKNIQDAIRKGKISFGHAKALLSSDNPEELMDEILNKQYSVRDVEKRVRPRQKNEVYDEDLEYIRMAIEEKIQFKTKLELKDSGKGRIIFEFDSPNALDQILQKLKD